MGWIGWTETETLDHTPQAIKTAKDGRVEMINVVLRAVFGKPQSDGGTLGGTMAPTRENFAKLFAAFKEGAES